MAMWKSIIQCNCIKSTTEKYEDISGGASEILKAINRFILLKHVMLNFKLEVHDIHNLDATSVLY